MDLSRERPPNPYNHLPDVAEMTLTSEDMSNDKALADEHAHGSAGGQNLSPHLSWSGEPEGTKSFAVTCFDPDAPSGSGWWHWVVLDLPASTHELSGAIGANQLPSPAFALRTDYGSVGYQGAGPPPGDMAHRYIFAIHALDVESLGLDADTPAAQAAANLTFHTLARGLLTTWYSA